MNAKTKSLERSLSAAIEGDVRFDVVSRRAYSVDASIYEIEPIGIVIPKHKGDAMEALAIAREHDVPIIPRGAATGITGGAIGHGLVMDFSKYLDQILSIDFDNAYAICQPGVVQDRLNEALKSKGFRLGPDTSTGNRATLGGMVGNNAAGSRSLKYGKMVDHVTEVEVLLSNGELVHFSSVGAMDVKSKETLTSREGEIYRTIARIKNEYGADIDAHFPKIPRRTSGYNLDELIKPGSLNVSKLIVGSEGTLGLVTEMKVNICPLPLSTGLCLIHFDDVIKAMEAVPLMLPFKPMSLEMIDDKILAAAGAAKASVCSDLIKGLPPALFMVEFEGSSSAEVAAKLQDFQRTLAKEKIGYAYSTVTNSKDMAAIWNIRKGGLGLLLSKRSYSRAIAFIEDISLPPELLGPFMAKFLAYMQTIGKEAGIYGHVGSGCMHIRPYIDLRSEQELQVMEKAMVAVADLLLEYGGSLSGEHGDGYVRSWLNKKMFGDRVYAAFCEVKTAFDPENLMNPGKIVHAPPLLHDLRLSPDTKARKIPTFLDFTDQGGFELAADLCNGNGLCRKMETTMCPSFQATHDERDTTRARAQALRAVINRRWDIDKLTSPELGSVLDLCLECKGCKSECPSHVDMAKMKSEYLYQYQEKWGYSLRSRLFGHMASLYRLVGPFATPFNWMSDTRVAKVLLRWLGVAEERTLPNIAKERFSQWFAKQKQSSEHHPNAPAVVLFNDTYTEFNQPEIGKAAFKILEALGYRIIVPPWSCCGKPLISKGILAKARKKAEKLVNALYPWAEMQIPIIGLEPSCLFALKDDYSSLVTAEWRSKAQLISSLCTTFDCFIEKHLQQGDLPLITTPQQLLVHGHCHHKSAVGMQATLRSLNALPGCTATLIDSGCCGMAGSFGYEAEHYSISLKIANLKLLPALRNAKPDTIIVADGISCRTQIIHAMPIHPRHIAEVIADRLSK
jgi:FAD/FMN-containing dehydrogenase/Fe-S oxidoreductase